jgi:hypothetical protein
MRSFTDNGESGELDKFLFNYLEGNLSEEQARELERQAAADTRLGSELELWKETLVTQDFYDTSLLEKNLLLEDSTMPEQKQTVNPTTSASLFMIALLTIICSIWPVKTEKEVPDQVLDITLQVPVAEKIRTQLTTPVSVTAEGNHHQGIKVQVSSLPQAKVPLTGTMDQMLVKNLTELKSAELSATSEIPVVVIPEAGRKKLSIRNIPAARTITRKQARQIARMKERALQRRMANEFQKGQVPYVVPLNTRNF